MTLLRLTEEEDKVRREIESTINGLHRRLNSFALINRLPPELLAEIFCFCRDAHWGVRKGDKGKFEHVGLRLRWTMVILVCRHWRDVAERTPRLWAHINFDHPKFSRGRSMVLAKGSPLHLLVNTWNDEQSALFKDINMDNVYSIDVTIRLIQGSPGALNVIPPSTSPIRFLEVSHIHEKLTDFLSIFAKCTFPAIQRLALCNMSGTVPSCLLGSTLKDLVLRTRHSLFVNPIELIRNLSQMSQLESLTVSGVVFRVQPDQHTSDLFTQKVSLPSLHGLDLQPPPNAQLDYLALLRCMDLPPQMRALRLTFPHKIPDSALYAILRIASQLLRLCTFRSMALHTNKSDNPETFNIQLWQEVISPHELGTLVELGLSPVSISLPDASQDSRIVWDEFLHTIDLQYVESLQVANLWVKMKILGDWRRFFGTTPRLKNLILKGKIARTVIGILGGPRAKKAKSNGDEEIVQPVIFPVETIRLSKVEWRTEAEVDDDKDGSFIRNLLSLKKRRGSVRPPINLVIRDCSNMDYSDVDLFERKGWEVEWDDDDDDDEGSGFNFFALTDSDSDDVY
ncbi:hypothetical protein QCA50_011677 [Cerrena zonata]|uniref:F-box domain-containing protein n=1 Tax=Cerrena zonata TaxID=2478898 RepID=A0AAW0G4S2_9APHY